MGGQARAYRGARPRIGKLRGLSRPVSVAMPRAASHCWTLSLPTRWPEPTATNTVPGRRAGWRSTGPSGRCGRRSASGRRRATWPRTRPAWSRKRRCRRWSRRRAIVDRDRDRRRPVRPGRGRGRDVGELAELVLEPLEPADRLADVIGDAAKHESAPCSTDMPSARPWPTAAWVWAMKGLSLPRAAGPVSRHLVGARKLDAVCPATIVSSTNSPDHRMPCGPCRRTRRCGRRACGRFRTDRWWCPRPGFPTARASPGRRTAREAGREPRRPGRG